VPHWLENWNRRLAKWLWWVVLLGLVGSLPVLYARSVTEHSANEVEFIMDYRDLLQVSATQINPEAFVNDQLAVLKEAGVNAMAVFESSLDELVWSGEVNVYNAAQAALLEGKLAQVGDNRTYLLFNKPEHEREIRALIVDAFSKAGVEIGDWSAQGRNGLVLNVVPEVAYMQPMQPNPIAMKKLHDEGFLIVPRLSDRGKYYDPAEMAKWLQTFREYGVKTIIFDGDAVTGFGNEAEAGTLKQFASQLKEAGIGIGAIENLKLPQQGFGTLARLLDYDVARLHSVSEAEMAVISPSTLADRIVLAVKDRNIRFIYLNAAPVKDSANVRISHPIDTIVTALAGGEETEGAIKQLKHFGFVPGEAHSFTVHHAPAETALRALAAAGAAALVALTVGLFLPSLLVPVTALGAIGTAGVVALQSSLLDQALALFVAIAAPTASLVLVVRWLRAKRSRPGETAQSAASRLGKAVLLYAGTSVLSLAAVPFVAALLNDITYSLVLQQFRGVSLLHLAPIALVAVYVFLYGPGGSVKDNIRRILRMPITVLTVVAAVVIAGVGYYYLSRTGNSGQASGLELMFRSYLENTFGVRPRFKEFMLAHPIFLLGLFLALRYRWATVLMIVASIGQLSMVDTFAHIHTPLKLSAIRVLLGLGLGAAIGLIAICAWQIGEALWRRYGGQKARQA